MTPSNWFSMSLTDSKQTKSLSSMSINFKTNYYSKLKHLYSRHYKMRIQISDEHLIFICNLRWQEGTVSKRSLTDLSETRIEPYEATESAPVELKAEEKVIASLPLLEFNAVTHTLVIRKDNEELTFDSALAVFRLDAVQLDSHHYVTVNLLGSGLRKLNGDELFYTALCYLAVQSPAWQFYGGLITVAAFRVSEQLTSRKPYVPYLLKCHQRLAENYRPRGDHSVRWFISSSLNLAIVCLYVEEIEEAEKLVEQSLSRHALNGIFPLTYMNFAQLLLLSGLLKFNAGQPDEAAHRFLECSDFCTYAMSQIFNLRNTFLLHHEMDCRTLMDTGYCAFRAAVLLTDKSFPADSKLVHFKIEHQRAKNLNFDVVVRRYARHIGFSPVMLREAAQSMIKLRT
jgi:tetratricopeptide (TPR) repeat protein